MTIAKTLLMSSLIGLSAALAPMTVSADTSYTWDFRSGSSSRDGDHTESYVSSPSGGPTVDATAWANTGAATTLAPEDFQTYGNSGLGIINSSQPSNNPDSVSPEHAFDNEVFYELVMFDFGDGNSVALTDINLGYVDTDADISLLAFNASSGGTVSPNGVTYDAGVEGLRSNGWDLVGNYDLTTSTSAVNASGVESRYWIVAAHNTAFGTACEYDPSTGQLCNTRNDHYKMASLAGILKDPRTPPSNVPAPPTFLLIALGLAWLGRKQLESA